VALPKRLSDGSCAMFMKNAYFEEVLETSISYYFNLDVIIGLLVCGIHIIKY
jgi:hypothetical protein